MCGYIPLEISNFSPSRCFSLFIDNIGIFISLIDNNPRGLYVQNRLSNLLECVWLRDYFLPSWRCSGKCLGRGCQIQLKNCHKSNIHITYGLYDALGCYLTLPRGLGVPCAHRMRTISLLLSPHSVLYTRISYDRSASTFIVDVQLFHQAPPIPFKSPLSEILLLSSLCLMRHYIGCL